jgi:uncharacterized membrane protein
MVHVQAVDGLVADILPRVRRISQDDLNWALAEGWRDFRARRGDVLILPLVYPLAGFAAAILALNKSFLPMLFPAVAGLSILGPAVAVGFYELARRREAGLESGWGHFIDPLRGRGRGALVVLTLGLVVLFTAWLGAASVIFQATIGAAGPLSLSDFISHLFTTPAGWTMIVLGNLVGFAFAIASLVLTLVSFPMIIDRPVSAVTAVATSLRAVASNPVITANWGVRVALLLAVGCLPLFLGLPIILPVLGYATWHLYTRLVSR